jgi:murein L,D-transpeptidase YcbB/YkuD
MQRLVTASILGLLAVPLSAQTVPAATPSALAVAPSAPATPIDLFYVARNEAPIWLKDDSSRAAAQAFAGILRNAAIDGLSDGPELAARVDAAIAANDDKAISTAWVRYVDALKAPVQSVSYGDPELQLKAPPPGAILAQAVRAPSLADYVTQTAAVNPFYAAIRDAALKSGSTDDPHVRATLDRLRLVPAKGRAILVDVANAELMMLEDGQVVDRMKVVVGKPTFETPLLAGTIHYVTFNPYWHIPMDVARRKVAPIVLKRGVAYLKAARYQTVAAFGKGEDPIDPTTVDWKAVAAGTADVHIRQLSGPQNMMGKMKFGFVNDYGIFLHDTPHKDFFAKAKRNLSLGCVRVEHPERLAQWLLGRDPVAPGDDSEQNVQMDQGVPIYISSLTARTDGDKLVFADDVYGLDKPGAQVAKVASADADSRAQ